MTETAESDSAPPAEDENEASVTDLLEQLGREVSALVLYESRLAVSRHKPEIRRTAGDVAAALAVALAFLTAFVLANAAVVRALSTSMPEWVAPLVLAAVWMTVGALLALYLLGRARRHTAWKLEDAEKARAKAEQAVRKTLEQLGPAISKEIALAAVPVATDMAEGVVEAGEEIIESADEIVDAITEEVPGGGVVNQMWDVVLMPGRLGIRVATTVLKRGEPAG